MNLRHKRVALLSLAALFAAWLAREAGFLNVQWYRATLVTDLETWKSHRIDPAGELTLTDKGETATAKTIVEMRQGAVGFSFRPARAAPPPPPEAAAYAFMMDHPESRFSRLVLRELRRAYAGSPPGSDGASLMRAELNGFYWMPLSKRGSCHYAVGLTADVNSQRNRIVWGGIDFNVEGLITAYELEEMLAGKIAEQVAKHEREARH